MTVLGNTDGLVVLFSGRGLLARLGAIFKNNTSMSGRGLIMTAYCSFALFVI